MIHKNRLYFHPTRYVCQYKCPDCIAKRDFSLSSDYPEFLNLEDKTIKENFEKSIEIIQSGKFDELEITGGGEPTLNKYLLEFIKRIKDAKEDIKIKLYTTSFFNTTKQDELVNELVDYVDELNITLHSFYDSPEESFRHGYFTYPSNNDNQKITKLFSIASKFRQFRLRYVLSSSDYNFFNPEPNSLFKAIYISDIRETIIKLLRQYENLKVIVCDNMLPEERKYPESLAEQIIYFDDPYIDNLKNRIMIDKNTTDCLGGHLLYTDGKIYENWRKVINNE